MRLFYVLLYSGYFQHFDMIYTMLYQYVVVTFSAATFYPEITWLYFLLSSFDK